MRSQTERAWDFEHLAVAGQVGGEDEPIPEQGVCPEKPRLHELYPAATLFHPGLHGLRGRLRRAAALRPADREYLGRLLCLDPPSVLRALRLANAPLYATRPDALSVQEVIARLGTYAVTRLLSVPTAEGVTPESIRTLWRHSLAAALTARSIAAAAGIDPDHAYICGLLHDLPLWLHHMRPLERSGRTDHRTWVQSWRLPRVLAECVEAASLGAAGGAAPGSLPAIAVAGEAVALVAGYGHPGEPDDLARHLGQSMLESSPGKREWTSRIAPLIEEAFAAVGLETSYASSAGARVETDHAGKSLFAVPAKGPPGSAVSALLEYSTEENPIGLLTGVTAVAGRCLGFDRVFFLQWNRMKRRARIRQKSDLTPTAAVNRMVAPSEAEMALLEKSLGETQAIVLRRAPDAAFALLDLLATDEILVAPVTAGGEPKGFLLLDHAYSLAPLDGVAVTTETKALAGVTSLLLDGLRLRTEALRTKRFAELDGLTYIYNRRAGLQLFNREIMRARRSRTTLSMLMVDMDEFKALNDRLGHIAGDSVLRAVARVMRSTFRRTDILCRYGGEEFIVVLPETDLDEASMSAARLFKAVESAGQEMGIPVTVSIGVTLVSAEESIEKAIHRADQALYASKDRGKNRFSVDANT